MRLKDELLNAHMFIHTSYIDNSPNSVCEAQLLGVPIIATNVGGISSLIVDKKTGILVPANDPIAMAAKIMDLSSDPKLCITLGKAGSQAAAERHNPQSILEQTLKICKELV